MKRAQFTVESCANWHHIVLFGARRVDLVGSGDLGGQVQKGVMEALLWTANYFFFDSARKAVGVSDFFPVAIPGCSRLPVQWYFSSFEFTY